MSKTLNFGRSFQLVLSVSGYFEAVSESVGARAGAMQTETQQGRIKVEQTQPWRSETGCDGDTGRSIVAEGLSGGNEGRKRRTKANDAAKRDEGGVEEESDR